MNQKEQLFSQHLSFADNIAAGYANIPGVQQDDVVSVARQALQRAVESYDAAKGPFAPYAGRVVRNALNNLYQREARQARFVIPESLLPGLDSGGETVPVGDRWVDSGQDIPLQAGKRESKAALMELLSKLPERTQDILMRLATGQSHAEIGAALGVSKQAIHKTASTALDFLREQLNICGFDGLDSVGLLKSAQDSEPPATGG